MTMIVYDLKRMSRFIDPRAEAKHFLRSWKFLIHVHSSSETWILVLFSNLGLPWFTMGLPWFTMGLLWFTMVYYGFNDGLLWV